MAHIGWIGDITHAVCGVPHALERETKLASAVQTYPLEPGTKSAVAHMWVDGPQKPFHIGCPQGFIARDKISSGPHVGSLAT